MSKPYRQALAVTLLACLLMLAWLLMVKPYLGLWQNRIGEAELLQKKQAALISLIRNRSKLEQQFHSISNNRSLREVYLDQKSGALADIRLQNMIRKLVSDSGGQVIQANVKKIKPGAKKGSQPLDEKSVTIEVVMQGSLKSIYTSLYKLENNRPMIVITNLAIGHNNTGYRVNRARTGATYRASYEATAFIL